MKKPNVYLYNGEGSAVIIEGLDNYETKETVEEMIDVLIQWYKVNKDKNLSKIGYNRLKRTEQILKKWE